MTRLAVLASAALLAAPSLALAGGANEVIDEGEPIVITESPGTSFSLPLHPGSLGGGGGAVVAIGAAALLAAAVANSGSH